MTGAVVGGGADAWCRSGGHLMCSLGSPWLTLLQPLSMQSVGHLPPYTLRYWTALICMLPCSKCTQSTEEETHGG